MPAEANMSAASRQDLSGMSSTVHRKGASRLDRTTRYTRCPSTLYSSRQRGTPRTRPGSHEIRCHTGSRTAPPRNTPPSRWGRWGKARNDSRSDRPNHRPRSDRRTGDNRHRRRCRRCHPRCMSPNHWLVMGMARSDLRSVAARSSRRIDRRTHGTPRRIRTRG